MGTGNGQSSLPTMSMARFPFFGSTETSFFSLRFGYEVFGMLAVLRDFAAEDDVFAVGSEDPDQRCLVELVGCGNQGIRGLFGSGEGGLAGRCAGGRFGRRRCRSSGFGCGLLCRCGADADACNRGEQNDQTNAIPIRINVSHIRCPNHS